MSFPEYRQKPQDHRSCLILVRPIGSFVSTDNFSKIWDQLNKLQLVSVGKYGREVSVRYVPNYPIENSEWGDFQYHRKVLGLICIAKHNEQVTGADLDKQYSDLKNLYDSTLLDSRLIILGLPRNFVQLDQSSGEYEEPVNGSPPDNGLVIQVNHYDDRTEDFSRVLPDLLQKCSDDPQQIAADLSETTRRRVLSYSDTDEACSYLNVDIEYMCQSMFYVLESKRLTATNIHLKQPAIITAPFEGPSTINMDLDVKSVRNRFIARCRKRIGDLCMLVDLPHDAVLQYQMALELLNAVGDEFWIGGALEGIAVASSLVLQTKTTLALAEDGMKRTSSFSGRSSSGILLDPSVSLHNSFNHLDLASTKPKLNVSFDDIIKQYREAISYYNKFSSAAIIEMEASLKATRLLIDDKRTKTAAEFLHHVAYVNLDDISYKERVVRYDVMGDLYHKLKFDRKAAFFKRVAAMHCVSPLLPSPAWSECYMLLLKAFPGFRMSFNPADYQKPGETTGWPGIKMRVFHELIYAARQLGNNAVIARHVSLCLHTIYCYMLAKEIEDLVQLLETCTRHSIDQGLPITTATGLVLPPVPFTSFPLLSDFEALKLPPQLEPHKRKQALPNNSVFIYSPMNFGRRQSRTHSVTEYDFCWVQGNPGSVEVSLHNPLPLELKITDLSLIVEGLKFQSYPSSHTLPAESGPHTINIMGSPQSHGTLKILGYTMTLFGVVSRCIFSELSHIKQNMFTVDVAPVLPSLHVSSDLPKSPYMATGGDNAIVSSAILQIYVGEQRDCYIKLKNNGKEVITKIDVTLGSEKYYDLLRNIMGLDMRSVEESLPLQPGAEAKLTIRTIGSMKLTDLPVNTLISPNHDVDSKHRASSALIESLLTITYTGQEGEKTGHFRECVMAVDTVLIPSISIISQKIDSVEEGDCHVVYEVFNESNMALDIKSSEKTVSLKPMQSDWIHCLVKKCDSCAALEECKQAIQSNVSMSWSSEERQRRGRVSTDRLEWTDLELDKLRRRPFTIIGCVTKNSCSRYLTGEPIHLSYTISNTSGTKFSDIRLQIHLYQDIASCKTEVQMGSSFVYIGPSTHSVHQVDSGEQVELRQTIAIFYSGQYIVECQCVHNGEPIRDIDCGLSILVT